MFQKFKTVSLISSLTLLVACGGGGGGGSSGGTSVAAEGMWRGTTSTGYSIDVLVLDNNQFWSMFGNRNNNGVLSVVGFDQGSGRVDGSTFSGSFFEALHTGVTDTGNITATTVANTSLNGSASYSNGTTSTFNLAPPSKQLLRLQRRSQPRQHPRQLVGVIVVGCCNLHRCQFKWNDDRYKRRLLVHRNSDTSHIWQKRL